VCLLFFEDERTKSNDDIAALIIVGCCVFSVSVVSNSYPYTGCI